tara:strand:- start:78 stop:314 length:237 start_codon:yes stop_codon:yes gene_type:complete
MSSKDKTVPKQPEYIRKVAKMWMEKENKNQDDLQLILLCAIALSDIELTKKVCEMGALPAKESNPDHIWLLQQYGYFI